MKPIKEIMSTLPQSCSTNDTLQTVANQMAKTNVGSLPVLDTNKKVIGMITDRDVCRAIGQGSKSPQEIKVQEAMTKEVHTITPEDDTASALRLMRTKRVGRLPVVDKENRLQGIVSLNRIVRKNKETSDKEEVLYKGSENVINTLHSIAERNGVTG